ncbi:hypothetical protein LZ30DRAFT_384170 [Colletotrichum cereale]|nr:hypothetical protein LZ30DRAFT_384170 [Colletotrichum cereale]
MTNSTASSPSPVQAQQQQHSPPIALQFHVRFRPDDVLGGQTRPTTQMVQILFDGAFEPLDNSILELHVSARPNGTLLRSGSEIDSTSDYEPQPPHNVCVIEEAIDLFQTPLLPPSPPSPPPLIPAQNWAWLKFWLPNRDSSNQYLIVAALVLAVLIQVAVVVVLLVAARSPSPGFMPSPSPSPSMASTVASASTPTDAAAHIRQSSLTLLGDLAPLIRRCVNAPLPLVAGTLDLVRQHYGNPYNPPPPPRLNRRSSSSSSSAAHEGVEPRNVTVSIFLAHVSSTVSDLCDADSSWVIYSRSPLKPDVLLLCQSITHVIAGLSGTWARVTGSAMLSWPASLSLATFRLGEELRERQATTGSSAGDMALLRQLDAILFRVQTPGRSQDDVDDSVPSLAEVTHQLFHEVQELETETAQLVAHVTLLTSILRDNGVVAAAAAAASAHTRPGWFPTTRHSSDVDVSLVRLAAAYDATLPLLYTCTALTWVVGLTRREMDLLVSSQQRAGNLTEALLAGAAAWMTRGAAADGRDGKGGGGARTTWYMTALDRIVDEWEETESWQRREALSSRADWMWWLHQTVAHWKRT